MVREIRVPEQAASVAAALELVKTSEAEDVVIRLAPDFEEPAEAWPLELEAGAGTGVSRSLRVAGPPDRAAVLRDVCLSAPGDNAGRVTLAGVVIRGRVAMSGAGCSLEDCEARFGVEIDEQGADRIHGCTIFSRNMGIATRGDVEISDNEITRCAIGVSLFGNPAAVLSGNTFQSCRAAGIVLQSCLFAAEGSRLDLAALIDESNAMEDCAHSYEIHVEVEGAAPLHFVDAWPLPSGPLTSARPRGGTIEVNVEESGTALCVVGGEAPPEASGTRKRKRSSREKAPRVDLEEIISTVDEPLGPDWSREVLGLEGAFSAKALRSAYRQKALEVHPDKQPGQGPSAGPSQASNFHRVKQAHEVLLASLAAAKARKTRQGPRDRETWGKPGSRARTSWANAQ